jgi:hypothetical protein
MLPLALLSLSLSSKMLIFNECMCVQVLVVMMVVFKHKVEFGDL